MFTTLAPYAQHSIVEVKLIAEGDKLRAHINRKRDNENDEEVISLSLIGTPEELDIELPLALAEHLLATAAPKSVAEQVKEQVEASRKDEDETPATPAKAKKAAAAPRKVKARAQKVKPEKPAKAEKPEPAVKARKGRKRRTENEPQTAPQGETKPPQGETKPPQGETNAAASKSGHVGAALPDGEAREAVPTGASVTGDGTGEALPAIPASSRDASTLDLF